MTVEIATAPARTSYRGVTYYFCSEGCRREFDSDPARYASADETAEVGATGKTTRPGEVPLEKHEPPYTKTGGLVAPKFGSAGSGGAEYERLPEAHDDREKKDRSS
jgi:YHS domain-containing protein